LPAPALAQSEPEAAPKRAGTVLVVEDNAEVAEVASAYLQQLGYLVKQVADAHEALELLGNDRKIDVVFSDILMPGGMTGLELGHAVRQLYPGLPVLLATGYSDSARDALAQGFVVLQKPFDLAALDQGLCDARARVPKSVQRAAGL
jgi:two-component system NtrC family sensor kinase